MSGFPLGIFVEEELGEAEFGSDEEVLVCS